MRIVEGDLQNFTNFQLKGMPWLQKFGTKALFLLFCGWMGMVSRIHSQ